ICSVFFLTKCYISTGLKYEGLNHAAHSLCRLSLRQQLLKRADDFRQPPFDQLQPYPNQTLELRKQRIVTFKVTEVSLPSVGIFQFAKLQADERLCCLNPPRDVFTTNLRRDFAGTLEQQ